MSGPVLLSDEEQAAGAVAFGWAGALRERSRGEGAKSNGNLKLGLIFATMAGVLSAVFNYALLAGEPLEHAAVVLGVLEDVHGDHGVELLLREVRERGNGCRVVGRGEEARGVVRVGHEQLVQRSAQTVVVD